MSHPESGFLRFKAASSSVRAHLASSATTICEYAHEAVSCSNLALLSGILHLSERLPYHQNYANETRRRKRLRCRRNLSLYKRAVSSRVAKPRNVRRNSYQSKDKNKLYIRYLVRGGGSFRQSRKFIECIQYLTKCHVTYPQMDLMPNADWSGQWRTLAPQRTWTECPEHKC